MDTISEMLTWALACPSVTMTLCFTGIYVSYYLLYVAKKPEIFSGDARLLQLITAHCPVASQTFWPTWWCFEARMQTICRAVIQKNTHVNYQSESLVTPDKGEIIIDWAENDSSARFPKDVRPTVILLPGLTGSSSDNYIQHMVHDAEEMGYRCVVFNNRGTGESLLKTPRTYCASNIEDLETVISHIKGKYPEAPLMGVGVSLGGCIIFNYMAQKGHAAQLEAGLVLSSVYDLNETSISLTHFVNYWLFNKRLADGCLKLLEPNIHLFANNHLKIDTDHVLKSETIRDFDERFTTKVFGYDSVADYYKDASLDTKVHQLARPVLCLSAGDDPFAPLHTIPVKEARENKNIAIVVTSHGGHIGFLEGTFPRDKNYMYTWFKQYVSAIFEHGLKME